MSDDWLLRAKAVLEERSTAPKVHPWLIEPARKEWNGGPGCETHPEGHQKHWIPVKYPDDSDTRLLGFDTWRYENTPTYCMGNDDVSRTLEMRGQWEPMETRAFYEVLRSTPGIVIDFGAQIGWYTTFALRYGREVLAIEPVEEHCGIIYANAMEQGLAANLVLAQTWIDGYTHSLSAVAASAPDVAIVKIDLEGNDGFALDVIEPLIADGKVHNILMEVSPVFNDSYPKLVRWLMQEGYSAEVVNPYRSFTINEVDEVVNAAPQVDMMFRSPR